MLINFIDGEANKFISVIIDPEGCKRGISVLYKSTHVYICSECLVSVERDGDSILVHYYDICMYVLPEPYLSLGVGFSVEGVQQKSPCGPQQPCSQLI